MNYANQIPAHRSSLQKFVIPMNLLVHIVVFSVCITSKGFPSQSFAHVLIGVMFSCVAAGLTFLFAKSNVPKFIAAFIVATMTVKLPLSLLIPEQTFLNLIPFEGAQLAQIVCERFFYFSVGFLGFAAGSIFASRFFWNLSDPEKRDAQTSLPEKGFWLLVGLYLTLQILRIVLLLFLQIGAPGVAIRELFIPRLSGILTILGTRGLLLVTSGLLAWALSRRSYFALAISMAAAVTYAFVEIAGGWRSGMYYYTLCGMWIFLAAEPSKLKNRLKPFAVGFVVLAFLLFIPVMEYRNKLRQGLSPSQAIQAVVDLNQNAEQGGLAESLQRVTKRFSGLDLYVLASYGVDSQPLGFLSLINGQAGYFFTFGILGTPEGAITASGMTYWGSISIALGDQWLWFGGVLLGLFIGGLPMICRHWFHTPMMRTVYECNVTITLLHLTMGNGAFLLYSKEILLSFLVCLLFKFLATNKRASAYFVPGHAPYPNS